jgi:hypothetical protein
LCFLVLFFKYEFLIEEAVRKQTLFKKDQCSSRSMDLHLSLFVNEEVKKGVIVIDCCLGLSAVSIPSVPEWLGIQ